MNYVLTSLSVYVPLVLDVIPASSPFWERIDGLFAEKLAERARLADGEVILVEATLYDIIVATKKQNVQAIRLLHFFNKLLEELLSNITDHERTFIVKNLRDFLQTLDTRYLNFVGELAVLNNLMKSKVYSLEGCEAKLPDSSKTIDFKLKRITDQSSILVEVFNIRLEDDKSRMIHH